MPDWLYLIWDIQVSFEYILKKHGENIDNPSIEIFINTIEKKITFKIKTFLYLDLLTPEIMKLLGSTENEITEKKNRGSVLHLEVTELV